MLDMQLLFWSNAQEYVYLKQVRKHYKHNLWSDQWWLMCLVLLKFYKLDMCISKIYLIKNRLQYQHFPLIRHPSLE